MGCECECDCECECECVVVEGVRVVGVEGPCAVAAEWEESDVAVVWLIARVRRRVRRDGMGRVFVCDARWRGQKSRGALKSEVLGIWLETRDWSEHDPRHCASLRAEHTASASLVYVSRGR